MGFVGEAGQPGTYREIRIDASPARVWDIVADVEVMARWSPELVRVEWQGSAHAPAEGARYIGHNEHPEYGRWRTASHFTEVISERVLTWCVLDVEGRYGKAVQETAQRMATWSFALTPADDDGTSLRQSVTVGPGPTGLDAFIDRAPDHKEAIIAYRLEELGKGMDATLAGIKSAAEGQRED